MFKSLTSLTILSLGLVSCSEGDSSKKQKNPTGEEKDKSKKDSENESDSTAPNIPKGTPLKGLLETGKVRFFLKSKEFADALVDKKMNRPSDPYVIVREGKYGVDAEKLENKRIVCKISTVGFVNQGNFPETTGREILKDSIKENEIFGEPNLSFRGIVSTPSILCFKNRLVDATPENNSDFSFIPDYDPMTIEEVNEALGALAELKVVE